MSGDSIFTAKNILIPRSSFPPMMQLAYIMTNQRTSKTSHIQYTLSLFHKYINDNAKDDFYFYF